MLVSALQPFSAVRAEYSCTQHHVLAYDKGVVSRERLAAKQWSTYIMKYFSIRTVCVERKILHLGNKQSRTRMIGPLEG